VDLAVRVFCGVLLLLFIQLLQSQQLNDLHRRHGSIKEVGDASMTMIGLMPRQFIVFADPKFPHGAQCTKVMLEDARISAKIAPRQL
jgi:hypothetical protein